MFHRMLPACLLAAAVLAANGCCFPGPWMCHGGAVCDSCGIDDCAGGCGDCGSCDSCTSCGSGGVAACSGRYGWPLIRHGLTCGAGCGGVYWDEWINDPPDCCDPCDEYGNWVGDACCAPWFWLSGLRSLWGYRYRPCGVADCDGGCASCTSGTCAMGAEAMPTEVIEEKAEVQPPAPTSEPASPPAKQAAGARHKFSHATYTRPASARPAATTTRRPPRTTYEYPAQASPRVSRQLSPYGYSPLLGW